VIISLFFTISKREIKCRFYEDDDETSIVDLNNASIEKDIDTLKQKINKIR